MVTHVSSIWLQRVELILLFRVLLPLPIPPAVCRALYPFNIAVKCCSCFSLAVLPCYDLNGLLQSFSNNSRTSATNPPVDERIGLERCSASNPHGQVQNICLRHCLYCCHIHYLLLAHGHFFLGFNASSHI